MTIHCVIRILKVQATRQLSKDIELAAVPFVGCAIEYQDGWGLGTVEYVYILRDSIEVGWLAPYTDDEVDRLITLGWEFR